MIELPIDGQLSRIIEGLAGRSLVLVAPPGSGKTTRVPVAILGSGLLADDRQAVIVLEPRRVAARAAAVRIAQEQGWRLGNEVGYQVRFEKRFSRETRLRFLTEGILTRQLLSDPFLETIGAVILDEFHERSLDGDVALALLREVQREVRSDLIVVVMSATLDAAPVARFLGGCPIVRVEGHVHEVAVEYRPTARPASADAIAPAVLERLNDPHDQGHLLVFLPGMAEIRRVAKALEPVARRAGAEVFPLHGMLPPGDQDRALAPSERRKIVLATNVAETSLTIAGVRTVIDSGLARIVRYDDRRGIDRWELGGISRASADQRAGRAGRTAPGRCIRLWSERDHRGRAEFEQPEIQRVDLCATVLALHSWGLADPGRFGWYEAPNPERVVNAERLLLLLGAVAGAPPKITPLGEAMLRLPVHPRLARILIAARECGRAQDGATLAALLSEKEVQRGDGTSITGGGGPRRPNASGSSDVLDRLEVLADAEAAGFNLAGQCRGIDPAAARRLALLRDQLLRRVRAAEPARSGGKIGQPGDEEVLRWLLLAFPDRLVKRRGAQGTGVMVGGRGVRLDRESVVRDADLFLAIDGREERRAGVTEIHVKLASAVQLAWLDELFPEQLRRERVTRYDESHRCVVCVTRLWYHDLLLREDMNPHASADETGRVLGEALRRQAAELVRGNQQAANWLARLEFLARSVPELDWPEFSDEVLGEVLDAVCRGKSTRDQVEQANFIPFLESRLDARQSRELREGAPQSLTLPSGRQVRLAYESGKPPVLAARVQDLFGWVESPRVARGRSPVLLHILGPNNRPVQITNDLRSFWVTAYQQVRKDLRGRYPKHAWPDNPLEARPISR
jgi:ATP-dependent helicase HrpB